MDIQKQAENIDLKVEGARAGSVMGASAASYVSQAEGWSLADAVTIFTLLYIILQIGLVLHKYWKIWKNGDE